MQNRVNDLTKLWHVHQFILMHTYENNINSKLKHVKRKWAQTGTSVLYRLRTVQAEAHCLVKWQMANDKQQTANCKLECNFRNTRGTRRRCMNLITKLKQSHAGKGVREWARSQDEDGRDTLCVCVSCSCCCHSCCNVNQLHYHKLLLAYVSVLPQSRCTSWRRQRGRLAGGRGKSAKLLETNAEKCTRLCVSGKQDQMMQLWAGPSAESKSTRR